jgi:hypothetical protein
LKAHKPLRKSKILLLIKHNWKEDTIIIGQQQNSLEETHKSFFACIFNKSEKGQDYGILQALLSIDMLIILLVVLVGIGSCLTAWYDIWQIGDAFQYKPNTIITFISLINLWNFAERVLCGFISEKLVMKYKVPRPLMLSPVLFFSCIGLLLIGFPLQGFNIFGGSNHWFCTWCAIASSFGHNFRHLWPQALLHFVQL